MYSHPQNLFTLLAGDYELHVSEEATGLCPTSLCVPTPGTTASHLSRGKPGRFRRFVRGVRPTPRPALWFKHVLLPHVPWQYYPSGRSYRRFAPEPIPGLNSELGFSVPWLVKVSYQRHLLQLGMADRLLGQLMARLRGTGLYRDALVMVVADHGIGFRVGLERRTVRPRNVQDLAPVPMIVKLPGHAAAAWSTGTWRRSTCCPRSSSWPTSRCPRGSRGGRCSSVERRRRAASRSTTGSAPS